MKKIMGLCLMGLVALLVASCSDDNDRIYEGVNNSYVKYEISVSQNIFKYYDVQATYKTLDEDTWAVVPMTANTATEKVQKTGVDVGKITPELLVEGTRNARSLDDIDDAKNYTVSSGYKISWYSPTATAKNLADTTTNVMTGAQLKEYVNSHERLTFINYNYTGRAD